MDANQVARLAGMLAQTYPFRRSSFDDSYPSLLADDHALLLVAAVDTTVIGYLLGFRHVTFYANGPVSTVEEILVDPAHRGTGVGRELMSAFERWATGHGCAFVALATRRAVAFYLALGYTGSAEYLRKPLRPPTTYLSTKHDDTG